MRSWPIQGKTPGRIHVCMFGCPPHPLPASSLTRALAAPNPRSGAAAYQDVPSRPLGAAGPMKRRGERHPTGPRPAALQATADARLPATASGMPRRARPLWRRLAVGRPKPSGRSHHPNRGIARHRLDEAIEGPVTKSLQLWTLKSLSRGMRRSSWGRRPTPKAPDLRARPRLRPGARGRDRRVESGRR